MYACSTVLEGGSAEGQAKKTSQGWKELKPAGWGPQFCSKQARWGCEDKLNLTFTYTSSRHFDVRVVRRAPPCSSPHIAIVKRLLFYSIGKCLPAQSRSLPVQQMTPAAKCFRLPLQQLHPRSKYTCHLHQLRVSLERGRCVLLAMKMEGLCTGLPHAISFFQHVEDALKL